MKFLVCLFVAVLLAGCATDPAGDNGDGTLGSPPVDRVDSATLDWRDPSNAASSGVGGTGHGGTGSTTGAGRR